MKLVIIDYGSGNLKSVENAFKNSIKDNNLNFNIEVTCELNSIINSDFIVLPGVGSFPDCKAGLQKNQGLIEVLIDQVILKYKPFLGICVGMQLMAENSLEKINTEGLGWFKGRIEKINNVGKDYLGRDYKIPHMGWNSLEISEERHPILKNITEKEQFYFVHSYYLNNGEKSEVYANTNYNHKIPAVIAKDNYIGLQFHPEKSSYSGQKLIFNWLNWKI
ncbi:imidazole glycerol phosphate synthase subunit HisH [bacterium]|nr:imidazole glycerol phosphate synthase subunit HisH [bacterium]